MSCTYRFPFAGAYAPCGGDHTFEQHNKEDNSSFARGLAFAVALLGREQDIQTEQGEEHTADRLLQVSLALRGVMQISDPEMTATWPL